ncbi:hypothetical protein O6H91_17G029600 [Diphasiastrum complanatum]|uniref:Uncharacterized protein n=2 Tax=Diphasiastrum complanatum TaxID=34168 RepID=A0ACC2B5E0_DIPCM|nr:hypothetical protein O6H91_17G029600 [Diphasiastrum complanatum]
MESPSPREMCINLRDTELDKTQTCDCNQTSEITNMEHIKTEDYHSLTINTACIKTDLQKQSPLSLKSHNREKIQSQPSKDYASELGEDMPTGRFFDALEGPELEVLKDHEQTLIPLDQRWPFLLRFPISIFGIPMGLGSQTMLWKNLALSPAMHFLHIPMSVNLILWYLAVVSLGIIFATYGMKCIFYFQAVRREYYHPVRVNYFFAPWISCMFLTLGLPQSISISIHPAVWCIFMMPVFVLELKIYGQWLSGGERRLSKVANPSTHMSVVGNFVGAQLAALVGWKEFAMAFWAIGLVHYMVVFVTLYQRLPTNETLPKELHPVVFLFVAAPSAASVAWEMIIGDFDFASRIVYFLALFLLSSLVRTNVILGYFSPFSYSSKGIRR